MANSPSYIVGWFNFIVAVLALAVGCIFVFDTLTDATLHWDCEFLDSDCNVGWRSVFTLVPDFFIALWTPVLLGAIAVSVHVTSVRQWTPKNNIVLALFLIFLAVFGAFGYTGMLGVITGVLAAVAGLVTAIIHFAGHKELAVLNL
mmetsp:Transcript_2826/g.6670  ORF Transcript_2826/g.6670 Transcript_2826/m.6670 type:complete len:146 (-) Transcript_2826:282-719(-)